ncbi:MAG TPA: bifunctional diguanylate cyclase/phosphodiesterase [Aquificaceae bacterium]|nr:bifunctional diguanylate cyclase/phosphodiesterase [Aquificaceae bacterium]
MKLSNYIFIVAVVVTVLIFSLVFIAFFSITTGIIGTLIQDFSRSTAKQTFHDMYNLMSKGWTRKELESFLEGLKKSYEDTPTEVHVFRSEKVKELFGDIEEPPLSPEVLLSLRTKKEYFKKQDVTFIYTYPILAERKCLKCHINVKENDILGVIQIRVNTKKLHEATLVDILKYSLILFPVPLIAALFVIQSLKNRISSSLKKLDNNMANIASLEDFSELEYKQIDFGFYELNRIRDKFLELVEKLRKVSVDKNVLEFEVQLLEKFIITSEAISDWKKFISDVLREISKILDFLFFFAVFKEGNNTFSATIFWNYTPSTKIKSELEEDLIELLKEKGFINNSAKISYENVILWKNKKEPVKMDFKTITKSIFVERPLIGGIVGIGVNIAETERRIKLIAIEGFLATLLNIVGSVKAINAYTQELEYYATRDPLTGLYNRRIFWEILHYEVERARRHGYKFALVVIDLDNFKLLNDRYGHEFGDKILVEFSNLLKRAFRKEDVIARYGGDEFVILLPYINLQGLKIALDRFLKQVENLKIKAPDGSDVNLSVSIGAAIYPDHAKLPKELFIVADNMMYQVKHLGKGGYKVPEKEDLSELSKYISETGFLVLDALERDKIIPYFQPILDLKSDEVYMFEVLARIEEKGEIISAGKFIDAAESLGIVHRMDYKVIEKALEICKAAEKEPTLFFNISPRVLLIPDFVKQINKLVEDFGYDKEKIVFEITERETVRNLEILKRFIRNLKEEGFRFALDDFGAGFASFTYVKIFPIDFIKIEGEFIRSMIESKLDEAFVRGAVTLARTAGIKTIAEYVEDEVIYNAVKSLSIDYAQGFYIGKPRRSPQL